MDGVTTLRPEVFESASILLADAFYNNPAHVYIFPEAHTRHQQLRWLLGGNLKIQPDLSTSFCLISNDEVLAMGFWTMSNGPKPSKFAKLRSGLVSAPYRLGPAGIRRLLDVTSGIDEQLEEALGNQPYWYLNNMVVAERLRGTGIGTRLMQQQLSMIEERASSPVIALTTQRPQNVAFYSRLGFQPVMERVTGDGPGKFTNWVMVRAHTAQ